MTGLFSIAAKIAPKKNLGVRAILQGRWTGLGGPGNPKRTLIHPESPSRCHFTCATWEFRKRGTWQSGHSGFWLAISLAGRCEVLGLMHWNFKRPVPSSHFPFGPPGESPFPFHYRPLIAWGNPHAGLRPLGTRDAQQGGRKIIHASFVWRVSSQGRGPALPRVAQTAFPPCGTRQPR